MTNSFIIIKKIKELKETINVYFNNKTNIKNKIR